MHFRFSVDFQLGEAASVSKPWDVRRKAIAGWYWEVLCLGIYFALLHHQLFRPPITGLADNGDFPKVVGHFNACDPTRQKDAAAYVYPYYIIDPTCNFDSHMPSSEGLVAWMLKQHADWDLRKGFEIAGPGEIHAAISLAALQSCSGVCMAQHRRFGSPASATHIDFLGRRSGRCSARRKRSTLSLGYWYRS